MIRYLFICELDKLGDIFKRITETYILINSKDGFYEGKNNSVQR